MPPYPMLTLNGLLTTSSRTRLYAFLFLSISTTPRVTRLNLFSFFPYPRPVVFERFRRTPCYPRPTPRRRREHRAKEIFRFSSSPKLLGRCGEHDKETRNKRPGKGGRCDKSAWRRFTGGRILKFGDVDFGG